MDQDKMKAWLVSMGLPEDRSTIISTTCKSSCQNTINSLSLDDLESLVKELYTKYNYK